MSNASALMLAAGSATLVVISASISAYDLGRKSAPSATIQSVHATIRSQSKCTDPNDAIVSFYPDRIHFCSGVHNVNLGAGGAAK